MELEKVVSETQHFGQITGDFNVLLGMLGGVRGEDSLNQQGILLHQLLVRCRLYAASFSSLTEGLVTQTTVDYMIAKS